MTRPEPLPGRGPATTEGLVLVLGGAVGVDRLRTVLRPLTVHAYSRLPDVPASISGATTAIVVRSGTRLAAAELARFPRLRDVVRPGSGTDNLDLLELNRRGVTLHRHPEASAAAVAEWALAAAVALNRRVPLGHSGLLHGHHLKEQCLARPLSDMHATVWGAGPVGRAIARALAPLVRDVGFAEWPTAPTHLPQRPPKDCLRTADLHIVALPLRPATRGLFGSAALACMGPRRPHLICAGRVETLDLPACVRSLRVGALGGLACDAVDPEHIRALTEILAPSDPANLLLTPHIGAQRIDVRARLDAWVIDTITTQVLPAWAGSGSAEDNRGAVSSTDTGSHLVPVAGAPSRVETERSRAS